KSASTLRGLIGNNRLWSFVLIVRVRMILRAKPDPVKRRNCRILAQPASPVVHNPGIGLRCGTRRLHVCIQTVVFRAALPSNRRDETGMTQSTIRLTVNGRIHDVVAAPDTALLHVLRNDLELNGPKYGCGLGECGTCTVLIDGAAARSCVIPIEGCT